MFGMFVPKYVEFLMAINIVSTFGTKFDAGDHVIAPRGPQKLRIPSRKCPPDAPYIVIVFELDALFENHKSCMVGF
jgi:hypothetical protein